MPSTIHSGSTTGLMFIGRPWGIVEAQSWLANIWREPVQTGPQWSMIQGSTSDQRADGSTSYYQRQPHGSVHCSRRPDSSRACAENERLCIESDTAGKWRE